MLCKFIFIVVYVKMGSYMTRHGKLHDNDMESYMTMTWHGMDWHGMAWLVKAWKWHGNACVSTRSFS
jgi:hypothetical protein